MDVLIQTYRENLNIPKVKVIKVKSIRISVSCMLTFQPNIRIHILTRKRLTDPRYRELLNERYSRQNIH